MRRRSSEQLHGHDGVLCWQLTSLEKPAGRLIRRVNLNRQGGGPMRRCSFVRLLDSHAAFAANEDEEDEEEEEEGEKEHEEDEEEEEEPVWTA